MELGGHVRAAWAKETGLAEDQLMSGLSEEEKRAFFGRVFFSGVRSVNPVVKQAS